MRLCILIAIFSFLASQVESTCPVDILNLFTRDVVTAELNMNITTNNIGEEIRKTKDEVEDIIKTTKAGIQSERIVLSEMEEEAYGKSMTQKKSIADCLRDDRVQMKLINSTESIIYSVCRADVSLFLVKLYEASVERVSKKLQDDLGVCIETYNCDCEKEKSCIIESLNVAKKKVDDVNSEVETKLKTILQTSQICADGKKSMVISMIKEQQQKFEYCADQILNNK